MSSIAVQKAGIKADRPVVKSKALPAAVNGASELYGAPPKNLKQYLERLKRSYPNMIVDYDEELLILKNGTKFHISDHRIDKTFQELLEKPDIVYLSPTAALNPEPSKRPVFFTEMAVSSFGSAAGVDAR